MAADLESMKRDYEAGMSLRALAVKYGCGKTKCQKLAKAHGWTRTADADSGQGGRTDAMPQLEAQLPYKLVQGHAVRLLERVGEILEDPEPICPKDLRSLAATLLDVRQLLNALSPLEAEEQRLRLEGLRRQLDQAGDKRQDVAVKFIDLEEAET